MKKILLIVGTVAIISYLGYSSFNKSEVLGASPILKPYQGGTGTSSAPSLGDILLGNANGTYDVVATSTLGITGGSSSFLDLTDTPASYTGQAGKVATVNGAEKALEFTAVGGTGTVTNVGMVVPTGFSVSGVPITTAGTSTITYASGYSLPLTASITEGSTAYTWGNHASAGYMTQAQASTTFVSRTDWTTHDNYPSACSAGQYVSAIGDTLTCATPAGTSQWTTIGLIDIYYATGNVGIGTTTPASNLTVSSGASVGANYNTPAPINGLIVEGNTGIGTSSPAYKLDVYGNTRIDGSLFLTKLATPAGSFLAVNGSGLVIATTTPSGSLDIVGLTATSSAIDADLMAIYDSGNTANKKITWANVKATLKTYFDTLYQTILTFGIASNNAVKIDAADVADNDYAKFTANGVEGRSYSEVRTDLGFDATPFYPAFSFATTTAWAGTTTIALAPAYVAETWTGVKCFTDVGTVDVSFNDGTNRMNLFNASTTVNEILLTTNNTFTASEKRYVEIGNPATSPTRVSCTIKKTLNPF